MHDIILICAKGLDELLLKEIHSIVGDERPIKLSPGQCSLRASLAEIYALNLHSRLANRVLLVLNSGQIKTAEDMYELAYAIQWHALFDVSRSIAVRFNGTNRLIRNTQFGALKIKDAIVDRFVKQCGQRPDVARQAPDMQIYARLRRDKLDICLDTSGASLHQRGYRIETGDAPLKEQVAAAILMRSGWLDALEQTPETALLDPMCGAGTIAIEAAMMATKRPPNLFREEWGFEHYLGHNEALWQSLRKSAFAAIRETTAPIYAYDISTKVIDIAIENAKRAGVEGIIQFKQCDVLDAKVDCPPGYIVSNPPYGERLGDYVSLLPLYDSLGRHLKTHFAHWHVSLLSSDEQLLKALKLRFDKKYAINNGKLDCVLMNYILNDKNLEQFDKPGVGAKDASSMANDDEGQHPADANDEFSNRLKKNKKRLEKWLKRENIQAYRLYDADLPHYNFAIDIYDDWVIMQEYAPPKSLPEKVAQERLQKALLRLPKVLQCDTKKLVLKTRQRQSGNSQYQKRDNSGKRVVVEEYGAKFYINPSDYLDVGLFLDHRTTRQMFAKRVHKKHVLNLFAYTGSVSVHAALHGAASVTSVDMSKTYVNWAKDNFILNGLIAKSNAYNKNASEQIQGKHGLYVFEQADCLKWLANRANSALPKYDAIFIDPPSFSNSKRMDDTWDVQRDHLSLLENAAKCLNHKGVLFFSNNLRKFKLDEEGVKALGLQAKNISQNTLPEDFKRNPKIHQCWEIHKI
uniref:bifunctional 23S rRNA (guanine(2069)-N(7))-methyltransferase RlmK/23S rRNA (guanine(2445)-N(2))-methyltransferase RlmL n=1 Tax=Ningiella ruwaisensis TaxID=2364274 RepID=UPI00109FC459|nr:bifunctional 23S rRNA (guanine(2069)-N(7))-methyltransferase RlmK/23S rRNA (guanine(2445)-N(2))-methyltransferase RlmL [Ningiella ruwaisensis]